MHILKYKIYRKDGIFGAFHFAGDDVPFAETLSHAYYENGTYQPIVKAGTYTCVRGIHHLHDRRPGHEGQMIEIETFEITGIAGHSGLLFHPLNYNIESEGCTGLGKDIVRYDSDHDGKITALDDEMITHSKDTFKAWMERLAGVNSFTLQVL